MTQQGNRIEAIPVLLTVEEAGELLRIGRTKAYALAREYRETNGASGLPVIDLGNVLRVPRKALEDLIGTDLATIHRISPASDETADRPTRTTSRTRPKVAMTQPDLFDSETT